MIEVSCVRFTTIEFNVERGYRDQGWRKIIERTWMHHHRKRDIVPRPLLQHQNLAASVADLLCRSTEQANPDAKFVREPPERPRCANGGSGNNVMPARMTDIWHGVILSANGDTQRASTCFGCYGGSPAGCAPCRGKSNSAPYTRHPGRRRGALP